MTDKPEVRGYEVTCDLVGSEDQHVFGMNTKAFAELTATGDGAAFFELIRLADHEAARAADLARIAELEADNKWLQRSIQSMIDQTMPLEPVPGDPKWSRRIQIDDLLKRIDELEAANAINMPGLLEDLDAALEDLELHGRHSDRGYHQLCAWYNEIRRVTRSIDAALAQQGKEGEV